MKTRIMQCPYEEEVTRNIQSGDIKPHIRAHVESCPLCGDLLPVYRFLDRFQQVAGETGISGKVLPSADALWQAAFPIGLFPARRADKKLEARVLRPIILFERFAFGVYLAFACLLTLFLLANAQKIKHFIQQAPGLSMFDKFLGYLVKPVSQSLPLPLLPVVLICLSLFILLVIFDSRSQKRLSPRSKNSF